ncbi:hypothetical protein Droror1_Dr00026859 [Drosera rotundifolia]
MQVPITSPLSDPSFDSPTPPTKRQKNIFSSLHSTPHSLPYTPTLLPSDQTPKHQLSPIQRLISRTLTPPTHRLQSTHKSSTFTRPLDVAVAVAVVMDHVTGTLPRPHGPRHRRSHSDSTACFFEADADDHDFLFDSIDACFGSSSNDIFGSADVAVAAPMAVDRGSSRSEEESSSGANKEIVFGGSMHRRSGSFEAESMGLCDGVVKKAMPLEKLAELAILDPKRAKRILANRQAAARSKERKLRYTTELERRVQTLQTEATSLSAQVTLLQRDTNRLTAENRELKLRLQALEQQAQLRDALHEALREEVTRLRIATGQSPPITGNGSSRGLSPQLSLSAHGSGNGKQNQQLQQQVHITRPSSASNHQTPNQQLRPDFSAFSHMIQ